MNFTSFTSTDIILKGNMNTSALLHILLQRQASLQFSFLQPRFDILIPVYFGDVDKDFDTTRTSAILISVKNQEDASHMFLTDEVRQMFSHSNDPILCILMDL